MNPYEQMKEALKTIMATATDCYLSDEEALETIAKTARRALSAPPRNCDVGTAKEQNKRYFKFCRSYEGCKGCPLKGVKSCGHLMLWSQMPYNAGCIHDEGGYCTVFDRPVDRETCNGLCCEYESEGGGDAE